jgi:8-oxo-dGTP pyrophosphatase MutT (NUDIX family)
VLKLTGPRISETVIARAAAVVLRDGHVLHSRTLEDAFRSLPGGRLEPGERAEEALRRELAEELGFRSAKIGTLLWRLENDFAHAERRYRETGFYYRVEIAAASCPLVRDEFTASEPHLRFRWFPLGDLADVDLRPAVVRVRLRTLRDLPHV